MTYPSFSMSNLMRGNFNWKMIGQIEFEDKENGLTGYVKMDASIMKKQDFFAGEIKKNGK